MLINYQLQLKSILIPLLSLSLLVACNGDKNSTNITSNPGSDESHFQNPTTESKPTDTPNPYLKWLELTADKTDMYVGESNQLVVTGVYDDSTQNVTNKIKWKSTESNYIYSPDIKGLLYAIHAGTVKITITYEGKSSNSLELTIKSH